MQNVQLNTVTVFIIIPRS